MTPHFATTPTFYRYHWSRVEEWDSLIRDGFYCVISALQAALEDPLRPRQRPPLGDWTLLPPRGRSDLPDTQEPISEVPTFPRVKGATHGSTLLLSCSSPREASTLQS